VNKQGKTSYQPEQPDRNALISELYTRYGARLYAYAIRSWQVNEDVAWELVYKTLYKVIDTYQKYTFESEEKFASFAFRIFINLLRNHYRDNKKEPENLNVEDVNMDKLQAVTGESTEESTNIRLKVLREVLDNMEDWQRILLLMRSDGVAYSEIADYVDKPEEQLKVYYQRLKKQITEKINEQI
jgi:RNA polymerase sigma factor (sigma-70 family)